LVSVYTNTRRFSALVDLIERRMALTEAGVSTLAEYGAALYQADRTEDAEQAWAEALRIDPTSEMAYRILATQIGQVHLYDRAAELLVEGRTRIGDPSLFRLELANIYGLAADYEAAADEYLALIVENEEVVRMVQARLNRLIGGDGAAEAIASAIERAVRRDPLNRPLRELAAWIAIERGDFESALDANIAIDRLQREEGQSLFGFVQAALAAGAFDYANEALTYILERHPNGPVAPYALFSRAEVEQRMAEEANERAFDAADNRIDAPHFEAALAGYQAFAERYPTHPSAMEALARQAELQQSVFRNYGVAEILLERLSNQSRNAGQAATARLDLGRLALQRGNLAAARTAFTQVEEDLRIGPLAETARLELALLNFYEGDFQGALARVEAMNENTATDVANDAIALKLTLRENVGPDSTNAALQAYADASLLARQQRHTEVLRELEGLLSTFGAHPISDEAAFLRIETQRALGLTVEAVTSIERFQSRYPQSHLLERTLFLLGEIQEHDYGDAAAALETYTEFLVRFPGSLLAPDARARIRNLRGDRPIG
ncbi:MAG: tetratricopeptide repeat protein, partial [Rubricoccaceae bacterium]|nr:tetratricopeptide repeat protein [Rubricoccaceae bacterium]